MNKKSPENSLESGTLIGILGHSWRAHVDSGGNIVPLDGSAPWRWFIAAEDRWHVPGAEVATRQIVVEGTPVVETRVRVPQGDVIQRVWVAPSRERAPAVVIEFENDSARAVAIAVSQGEVVAPRAARVLERSPDDGLPLPSQEAFLSLPLGHRTRVRIALPCDRAILQKSSETVEYDDYLGRLNDWPDVVRGWIAMCERASRFVLPDVVGAVPIIDRVTAERCQLALDPPVEFSDAESATRSLISWRDLVRMGLDAPALESVVSAVELVARNIKRSRAVTADAALALAAAAYLLPRSEGQDSRSAFDDSVTMQRDLQRVIERAMGRRERSLAQMLSSCSGSPSRMVDQLESGLVQWTDDQEVTLCPGGIPEYRLGANIEAHGLALGSWHEISFAIRWHGARPAVIWEVVGPPGLRLRSGVDPAWSTTSPSGEGLWQMNIEPGLSADAVSFS